MRLAHGHYNVQSQVSSFLEQVFVEQVSKRPKASTPEKKRSGSATGVIRAGIGIKGRRLLLTGQAPDVDGVRGARGVQGHDLGHALDGGVQSHPFGAGAADILQSGFQRRVCLDDGRVEDGRQIRGRGDVEAEIRGSHEDPGVGYVDQRCLNCAAVTELQHIHGLAGG